MEKIKQLNSITLYELFKGRRKKRKPLKEELELLDILTAVKMVFNPPQEDGISREYSAKVGDELIIGYDENSLLMSEQDLRTVILHELSHIARGDIIPQKDDLYRSQIVYKDTVPYFTNELFNLIQDSIINESLLDLSSDHEKVIDTMVIFLRNGKSVQWTEKEYVDYIANFLHVEILKQGGVHKKNIVTDLIFKISGQPLVFAPPKKGDKFQNSYLPDDGKVNPRKEGEDRKNETKPIDIKKIKADIESFQQEIKSLSENGGQLLDKMNNIGSSSWDLDTLAEVDDPISINWETVLTGMLSDIISYNDTNESWAYPNYIDEDEMGEVWETLPVINLVIDTSSSMYSKEILDAVVNVIAGIGDLQVRIVQIDTEVKEDKILITSTDKLKRDGLLLSGGGGTYLSPAFSYIKEQGWDLNPTIVITDGYIENNDHQPVLPNRYWVVINGTVANLPENEDFEEITVTI